MQNTKQPETAPKVPETATALMFRAVSVPFRAFQFSPIVDATRARDVQRRGAVAAEGRSVQSVSSVQSVFRVVLASTADQQRKPSIRGKFAPIRGIRDPTALQAGTAP